MSTKTCYISSILALMSSIVCERGASNEEYPIEG